MIDVPDRVAWMRKNRRFNLAITGPGFSDAKLVDVFGDEPVWIIAYTIQFEDLIRMLGFVAMRFMLPRKFEDGFKEYMVEYGADRFVFRVWNPGFKSRNPEEIAEAQAGSAEKPA